MDPRSRRMRVAFVSVLLLLLIGGAWLYGFQGRLVQSQIENELMAMAHLKADQIRSWRANQLAEADELASSRFFTESVARWLNTRHPGITSDILDQFHALQRHYQYADVLLADSDGQILLSLNGTAGRGHLEILPTISASISGHASMLSDLYACKLDTNPHISVVVPLFGGKGKAKSSIGAVIMMSEARDFLYPLMRWPKPSQSGETLLVRRDGNSVLFLNDLRFRPNAAMNMRIPISATEVPAVMAVLGKEGVVYGKDYRGMAVVAAILPIANSPWFMIAKINQAEAFASWKLTSTLILMLMLGLVVFAGSMELIASQWNEKAHYRALYESEAAQRKSEERFKIAAESLGDVIFEWDLKERIDWFGDVDSWMGYEQGEFPGTLEGWIEAVHPEDRDRVTDALNRHIRGEAPYEVEYRIRKKDGDYAYCTSRGKLILNSSGEKTGWIGAIMDITKRKRVENLLLKSNEDLAHSNRELEQFAYVVSHDLQEPLRTVTSYTQLLARRYENQLDSDAQDFMQYIVDGAGRMQKLIQDLLSYARITTNASLFVPVNLGEVFAEAVANLQAAITESGAEVTKDDLPTVYADYRQMVQVIQNLIGNAIKFRKTGVAPCVHVAAERADREWMVSVKDNGIGIDPQYFKRIFAIFQRLHGKQEYSGNGIGLALCQRIVNHHGGRMWVESAPGEGATFHFTIVA